MLIPNEYVGREQAFIKHTILKTYLERLFMIIGQSELIINYVDCFAGPWSDETEDLTDTSIGISINQMKKSVATFKKLFRRNVKFRALYIEKNATAYKRLEEFLGNQKDPDVTMECIHGDYTTAIPEILSWSQQHFTFFFVDPKGWKGLIGPRVLKPLLERPKSEFLINVMYDFVNRAANIKKHDDDIADLLGQKISYTGLETAEQRQVLFLDLYMKGINSIFNGRTANVAIEKPGKERVLYFLVYLTRHVKGIIVFKSEAESMVLLQQQTQVETKLKKQQEKQPIADLFGIPSDITTCVTTVDRQAQVCQYLIDQLSSEPLLIDNECWAKFLVETDFYPTDFQKAIKSLFDKGMVVNLDADIKRRTKHYIRPDWPKNSERWHIVSTKGQL